MSDTVISYAPYETAYEFHKAIDLTVKAIMGPFGSGKSVACVNDLLYIAFRQKPNQERVRNTRFGIIRATYPNLKTTTKKTIELWIPPHLGRIKESVPMEGLFTIPLSDGTKARIELMLIAIDDETSIKKLRSTDFTAIWINEATEVSKEVFNAAIERKGRYPSNNLGTCTWGGVIMDFNMPPKGHWLNSLFNSPETPDDYKLFIQPPAAFKHISEDGIISYTVNPDAENLTQGGTRTIEDGLKYYEDQIRSKKTTGDLEGIDQLLCLMEVTAKHGKPVWSNFSHDLHVSKEVLTPINGLDTLIGIDTSGIHPAALIAQFVHGKWVVFDELYGEEAGFEEFVQGALLPILQVRYQQCSFNVVCDPANAKDSFKAMTPVAYLRECGLNAVVANTNQIRPRVEAVARLFSRTMAGLLFNKTCELCIASCGGGYVYKKLPVKGTVDEVYSAMPAKNNFSHIADALQYLALYIMKGDIVGVMTEEDERVKRILHQRMAAKRRIL